MGNDSSKSNSKQVPQKKIDPLEVSISQSYPPNCDEQGFLKVLGLDITSSSNYLNDDVFSAFVERFGKRLFLACKNRQPPNSSSNILSKETYVSVLYDLLRFNCEDSVNFLLSMYISNEEEEEMKREQVAALITEIIMVNSAFHQFEASEMDTHGYNILDEEVDVKALVETKDSFVALKAKPETTHAKRHPRGDGADEDETYESTVGKPVREAPVLKPFSVPQERKPTPTTDGKQGEEASKSDTPTPNAETSSIEEQKERQLRFEKMLIQALVTAILRGGTNTSSTSTTNIDSIQVSKIKSFILSNLPRIVSIFPAMIQLKITAPLSSSTPESIKRSYNRVAALPDGLRMESSDIWSYTSAWVVQNYFELTRIKSWKVLYNSKLHGQSFNRFIHHVVGYQGETLFFIITKTGEIIGGYVSKKWELGSQYFGSSDVFVFGLAPTLAVRRVSNSVSADNQNFVYCFTNKKSMTGRPPGIGFGGQPGHWRLGIDEDFISGTVRSMDSTFETGPLSPNPSFEVAQIEVWGASSDHAEMGLLRERRLREKDSERARKAAFQGSSWQSGPDKFIMDLVGITGAGNGFLDDLEKSKQNKAEQAK